MSIFLLLALPTAFRCAQAQVAEPGPAPNLALSPVLSASQVAVQEAWTISIDSEMNLTYQPWGYDTWPPGYTSNDYILFGLVTQMVPTTTSYTDEFGTTWYNVTDLLEELGAGGLVETSTGSALAFPGLTWVTAFTLSNVVQDFTNNILYLIAVQNKRDLDKGC